MLIFLFKKKKGRGKKIKEKKEGGKQHVFNEIRIKLKEEVSIREGGKRADRGRKRQVTHGKPKKRDNKNDIYQTM